MIDEHRLEPRQQYPKQPISRFVVIALLVLGVFPDASRASNCDIVAVVTKPPSLHSRILVMDRQRGLTFRFRNHNPRSRPAWRPGMESVGGANATGQANKLKPDFKALYNCVLLTTKKSMRWPPPQPLPEGCYCIWDNHGSYLIVDRIRTLEKTLLESERTIFKAEANAVRRDTIRSLGLYLDQLSLQLDLINETISDSSDPELQESIAATKTRLSLIEARLTELQNAVDSVPK